MNPDLKALVAVLTRVEDGMNLNGDYSRKVHCHELWSNWEIDYRCGYDYGSDDHDREIY
jgi:hypothetical protein